MYVIKLAVMLLLIGGIKKEESQTQLRGESHLLIVGDPGILLSHF